MKMHDEKLIKLNPAMSLKVASLMAKAVRKAFLYSLIIKKQVAPLQLFELFFQLPR
jgi:hypothetical protein